MRFRLLHEEAMSSILGQYSKLHAPTHWMSLTEITYFYALFSSRQQLRGPQSAQVGFTNLGNFSNQVSQEACEFSCPFVGYHGVYTFWQSVN